MPALRRKSGRLAFVAERPANVLRTDPFQYPAAASLNWSTEPSPNPCCVCQCNPVPSAPNCQNLCGCCDPIKLNIDEVIGNQSSASPVQWPAVQSGVECQSSGPPCSQATSASPVARRAVRRRVAVQWPAVQSGVECQSSGPPCSQASSGSPVARRAVRHRVPVQWPAVQSSGKGELWEKGRRDLFLSEGQTKNNSLGIRFPPLFIALNKTNLGVSAS